MDTLETCDGAGWIQRPHSHWVTQAGSPETIRLFDDPIALKGAKPAQPSQPLTALVRVGPLSDGTPNSAYESGLLVGVQRR